MSISASQRWSHFSHLLGLAVAPMWRTHLSEHGAPPLVDGRYADVETG
ncbi:hypothetical protein [Mycolicibacterium porcinum]